MAFEKNPPVVQPREHQGQVHDFAAVIQIDRAEQRFDVVGMQPDASVGPVAIDSYRVIGAVNPNDRHTQPDPIFAERIVGTGFDFVLDHLALGLFFALNRGGDPPGRILAHLDHLERANRRPPLLARLPNRDWIRAGHSPILEMKEHPLRQVNLDKIRSFKRNDMAIVDMKHVAGMERVSDLLAVVAREDPGTHSESRTDSPERVAVGDDEIKFAADDPMR